MMTDVPSTWALVLAGGLARRMGGGDKPLVTLVGLPLIAHAIARLAALVGASGARAETVQGFLDSAILRPEIVAVVGRLGEAALEADQRTAGKSANVGGPTVGPATRGLPSTGTSSRGLWLLSGGLLLAGVALVGASRRPRTALKD